MPKDAVSQPNRPLTGDVFALVEVAASRWRAPNLDAQ
jgi:hypothetical protein